jgi:hypothetical protein
VSFVFTFAFARRRHAASSIAQRTKTAPPVDYENGGGKAL